MRCAKPVTRRTAEIGIRVALGAQRPDVIGMVIRESLAPVAVGLILGIAAAGALTRLAASLLFGVSRSDPWTIAGAGIVLLLTAAVAAALPARRASGIDPMRALRHE
jgi:putative ABC transport system permease protein